jgi:hypothetical protein
MTTPPIERRGAHPATRFDDRAARAALGRLLSKGPLDKWPKRRGDLEMLLALACTEFEPRRAYREGDVNERLRAWLARFTAPGTLDHVTFRRLMIDARLLLRDASGSAYRLNPAKLDSMPAAAMPHLDPGAVLVELSAERDRRKRDPADASP